MQLRIMELTLPPGIEAQGQPGAVTFGDRFIQFGKFRLGTINSPYLILTHSNGNSMIAYESDGSQHPHIFHSWAPKVNHRSAQGTAVASRTSKPLNPTQNSTVVVFALSNTSMYIIPKICSPSLRNTERPQRRQRTSWAPALDRRGRGHLQLGHRRIADMDGTSRCPIETQTPLIYKYDGTGFQQLKPRVQAEQRDSQVAPGRSLQFGSFRMKSMRGTSASRESQDDSDLPQGWACLFQGPGLTMDSGIVKFSMYPWALHLVIASSSWEARRGQLEAEPLA